MSVVKTRMCIILLTEKGFHLKIENTEYPILEIR